MKPTLVSFALLLLATPGCIGLCGGAPGYESEASVYVNDAQTGDPVPGATIRSSEDIYSYCADNDAKGCIKNSVSLHPGTHTLVVSAPGYLDSEVELTVESGEFTARAQVPMTRRAVMERALVAEGVF